MQNKSVESQDQGSFREHALSLAARGRRVFPCNADKTPRTERGFKDATTDPAQIEAWASDCPHALVGIATGPSGLLVVDLDEKDGKQGVAEWARLCAAHSSHVATHTIRTLSGGLHHYFWGAGRTTTGELAPGIDTRGGFPDGTSGGYVIAWPDVVADIDIEPAPQWLLERLTPRSAARPTAANDQIRAHVTPPELRRALTHAELLAFVQSAGGAVRSDAQAVIDGKAWGVKGGRDTRLSALCWALVRAFRWLDPDGTAELFGASCAAVQAEDGGVTDTTYVARKLGEKIDPVAGRAASDDLRRADHAEIMRSYDEVFAQHAAQEAKCATLKAAAKRQTPETRAALKAAECLQTLSPEGLELAAAALARVTDAGTAQTILAPVAGALPENDLAEKLTALVAKATKARTVDGNDWILGTTQGFFLRAEHGYEGPFSAELMPARARDTLEYVPGLSVGEYRGPNYQPKPASKLLHDYGRVPSQVDYVLYGETRLEGDTLLYNALAMPELEPEHDPEIARWLELLAGDQHAPFLDWLATFLHFERPTCAVMIKAFPGVGKGLLIDGLAELFGSKAVAFAEAIGPYSARMARCPLVVADETLAAGQGVNAVDELKKLVGDSAFTVADKYIRAATLQGCVRVVLTTNHHGGFKFGRELTEADVAALDQRVLLLQPGKDAAAYLTAIGGRAKTEAWVKGRGLARHVLWLEQTRQVATGDRFLVQGRGGLERLLASDSKGTSPLLTAMVNALCKSDPGPSSFAPVEFRHGKVWVNKALVVAQWATLNPHDALPAELGAAWDILCVAGSSNVLSKGKHNNKRYSELRAPLLVQAIARFGAHDGLRADTKRALGLALDEHDATELERAMQS